MITVIYRIYEINDNQENLIKDDSYFWCNGSRDTIIDQNMLQCKDNDDFKTIIKSLYGDDIKFKKSSKLKPGDVYCTIISYNAYGESNYINVNKNICSCCGKEYLENNRTKISTSNSDILYYDPNKKSEILDVVYQEWLDTKQDGMYGKITKLDSLHFCSLGCKQKYLKEVIIPKLEQKSLELRSDSNFIPEEFIDKHSFDDYHIHGYIYKITKKSTGEFYVGQTRYTPIFRWGQHLLTERFKLNNICDYKFEVIEIVNNKDNILEREAYWINKCRNENPSLSLNIVIPKEHIKPVIELAKGI